MKPHLHWHRKVGPVWGPYTLTVPPMGSQLYRCRCGHETWRDRAATEADIQACCPIKIYDGPFDGRWLESD